MAKAVFKIKVNKESPYKNYLQLVNGVMRLTDKELEVLTLFMEQDAENLFSKESRRYLTETLGIKNINVYVKKFKDANLVIKTGKRGIYKPIPLLVPRDSIEFKMDYVEVPAS